MALLEELKTLIWYHPSFSEEQIEQMGMCSMLSLEELRLLNMKNKGLPFDQFVPNLRILSLANSSTSSGDVSKISQLQHLEILDLQGTKISSDSVKKLASLKKLKELDLSRTNIRDASFSALSVLPELKRLTLNSIHLSLNDLIELGALSQLEYLDIRNFINNNITKEHIEQLSARLPNCQILY